MKKFSILAFLGSLFAFAAFAQAAPHSMGSNVITPQGTVYTITVENGQTVRRPYTSAGAFLSYSFNTWESIAGASAEDLALPEGSFISPQDGKVICSDRGSDKGTCYLVTDGKKAGFTSADVFTGLGHSFKNVAHGDVSFLPSAPHIDDSSKIHSPGTLVNKNGTVYVICSDGLVGLPSTDVLDSWGYSQKDIVPANSADASLPVTGSLSARPAKDLSPIIYCRKTPPPQTSGIDIYSPAGGEQWPQGSTQTIKWSAPSAVSYVNISITRYDSCLNSQPACLMPTPAPMTIASIVPNSGSYNWTIPNCTVAQPCATNFQITAGDYLLTVSDVDDSGLSGTSAKPFTITLSGSTANQPPVITSVGGPTSLNVSQTGTWTINAYDPDGSYLTYGVNWGEASGAGQGAAPAPAPASPVQTGTFTHSYSQAGSYKVTFTVTDNLGASAQSTITLSVGQTTPTNNPPKITNVTPVPSNIQPGQSVNFTWFASDPDYDNLSWSGTWGDGNGFAGICPSSLPNTTFSAFHAWKTAGTYTVSATASDCKGGSDTRSFSVVVGSSSQPSITVIKNLALGTPIYSPGSAKVKIGSYWISASAAADASVSNFTVTMGSNGAEFQNLTLMKGSTQLGAVQKTLSNNAFYSFYPAPLVIAAGSSILIDVSADVLFSATSGTKSTITTLTACLVDPQSPTTALACSGAVGQDVVIMSVALGDATLDGAVTIGDALLAQRHADGTALLTGQALLNAEVTGEGTVNGIDALLIANYAGGLISKFPKEDGSVLKLGDANRSGSVTIADALAVGLYVSGNTPTLTGRGLDNADVDGDGKITNNDSTLIANFAGGLITSFPRTY